MLHRIIDMQINGRYATLSFADGEGWSGKFIDLMGLKNQNVNLFDWIEVNGWKTGDLWVEIDKDENITRVLCVKHTSDAPPEGDDV